MAGGNADDSVARRGWRDGPSTGDTTVDPLDSGAVEREKMCGSATAVDRGIGVKRSPSRTDKLIDRITGEVTQRLRGLTPSAASGRPWRVGGAKTLFHRRC